MKCYTCISKKCDCMILPYNKHINNINYFTNRFNFHGKQYKFLEKKIDFYRTHFINVDNDTEILNIDEFLNTNHSLSYSVTQMIYSFEKHKTLAITYCKKYEIEKKELALVQKNNIAYVLSRLNLPIDIYYHTIQFV